MKEASLPPPEPPALEPQGWRLLLQVAREAIRYGLDHGAPSSVDASLYPQALQAPGASFVTLRRRDGELRGCVGSSRPVRALVVDVARNAFASAFLDPRFPPLSAPEFPELDLEISVLGPLEPIPAGSREAVLNAVVPGRDGLVLECPGHRALFLPAVWRELPEPEAFLSRLQLKAGLDPRTWPPDIQAFRFVTRSFGGPLAPAAD